MSKIRVLIADDNALWRCELARLIHEQQDMEVAGEAVDGQAAVELARQVRPDVVIMDIRMPRLNGIEATRLIVSELPRVRVIGLSSHKEARIAAAMKKAGAVAYLTKGDPPQDLLVAIRAH